MPVAELTEVPNNPMAWAQWSFANMAHHRDIIRAVFATQSIALTEYILDPIDVLNLDRWLAVHQEMHRQQNAAVGISGYDISQLDVQDPEDLQAWISAHADEHIRIGQILNLG